MESFCGSNRRVNVRPFACDKARKFPAKLALGAGTLSTSDAADADTATAAITALTQLDTGAANKMYFIHTLRDPQDKSQADKKGAVGEGPEQTLVEGKPGFEYRVEIGMALYKELRKLNKQVIPVMTYDDEDDMWGCVDSNGVFAGCPAIFFISDMRQQTASAPVSALISISYLSAKNYNDEAFYVPMSLGEFEPGGLLDAYLSLNAASLTTNVRKIDIKVRTAQFNGYINIVEKYNASIVAGMFTAFTGTTFATSLVITSWAYDATLKSGTLTLDSTAYTALASGAKIKIKFGPVATLAAAGITGIEGVEVIISKP
jgi:hypothetical protein